MVYFVLPFSLPSFTELMPGAIPGEDSCVYGRGGGGCVYMGGRENVCVCVQDACVVGSKQS